MSDKPLHQTTDLPAALRYLAQYHGPPACDRMIEAADEIERLRNALSRIIEQCDWEWAARVAREALNV